MIAPDGVLVPNFALLRGETIMLRSEPDPYCLTVALTDGVTWWQRTITVAEAKAAPESVFGLTVDYLRNKVRHRGDLA